MLFPLLSLALLPLVRSTPAATTDFAPWLSPSAARPVISVSASGALRECGTDTVRWKVEGAELPEHSEWTVVPLVTSPGGAQLAAEGSHLWDVRGKEEKSWRVDYAAGTSVVYYVSTWLKREGKKDLYIEGRSANITVKEGKRRDCIPASHWPIILDLSPLASLSPCTTAKLAWEGGEAPYSIYVDSERPSTESQLLLTTEKNEAEWNVNWPQGSSPRLTITDRYGWSGTLTSHVMNITSSSSSSSSACIPRSHLLSPPWYTSLNAILAFSMLAGVIAMCAILLGGKSCVERRRRAERGERERLLNSDQDA